MFLVFNGSHEAIYWLTDFSLIKNGFAMLLTGSTGPSKKERGESEGYRVERWLGRLQEARLGGSQAVITVTRHQ